MRNLFLENTYFSLSTPPKTFRDELPNIAEMWGNTVRPLSPMRGLMTQNESRILNSAMPEDEKFKLIHHIQQLNEVQNEHVAEKVNAAAIVGSMFAGVAATDLVISKTNPGLPKFFRYYLDAIVGVNFAPMASKVIEKPLRIVVDAIRGARQEEATRRYLDSEGIR